MSAFATEYQGIVRAVVSDIGIVTGVTTDTVQAVKCKALWDTGAVYSVISNAFAAKLGLIEFDRGRNYTAQGSYETSVYLASIVLPSGMIVPDLRISSGANVIEAAQGVLLAQFKWALARASGLDNPIIRTSRLEMAYA